MEKLNMHELGIVIHIAKTLEEFASENELTDIRKVTLQVGEVSGIMTDLFIDAWDYFKKHRELIQNAELVLETLPAVTWCDHCKQTYETVRYGKECPYCHSTETWLQQGDECIIKEIEVE